MREITVAGITFQQALAFKVPANAASLDCISLCARPFWSSELRSRTQPVSAGRLRLQLAVGDQVMTRDRVFIEDLRIETVIGVFDWEREIKQTISLDLEMAFDIGKAAKSDAIEDTLDYKAVAKRLIQFVESSEFQLVEALAEHCASIILEEFPVARVRVKLSKPGAVRGSSAVGVVIERTQAIM